MKQTSKDEYQHDLPVESSSHFAPVDSPFGINYTHIHITVSYYSGRRRYALAAIAVEKREGSMKSAPLTGYHFAPLEDRVKRFSAARLFKHAQDVTNALALKDEESDVWKLINAILAKETLALVDEDKAKGVAA